MTWESYMNESLKKLSTALTKVNIVTFTACPDTPTLLCKLSTYGFRIFTLKSRVLSYSDVFFCTLATIFLWAKNEQENCWNQGYRNRYNNNHGHTKILWCIFSKTLVYRGRTVLTGVNIIFWHFLTSGATKL